MRLLGRTAMGGLSAGGGLSTLCAARPFRLCLQRVHQVDDVARPLLWLGKIDLLAGCLAPHQGLERILILVLEFGWIEMGGLAVQDMAGELDHVFRDLRALDVLEIVFLVARVRRDSAAWCRAGPCRAARSP